MGSPRSSAASSPSVRSRRGQPAWTASDRAGWVSMAVIGVVVGAVTTSILAGMSSATGAEISDAPTLTGVLTAENTSFVETSLQMKDGEVLGLFVTNETTSHTPLTSTASTSIST